MQKPTLSQIAKQLGLSTATVSLAMKENSRISDLTRAKVKEALRESGYIYQRSAAGLRKSKTDTVGIVLNNVSDPSFSELLGSIESELAKEGRTVFLCNTDEDVEKQSEFIRKMSEYNADGIVLVPAMGTQAADLEDMKKFSPPIVCVSREITDFPVDSVVADETPAGYVAAKHLLNLGHRRIAAVGGTDNISPFNRRMKGIRQAFHEAGQEFDPALVFECRPVRAQGYEAAERILNVEDPPTAAIGYNAIVTLGLKAGLQRLGKKIGEDFSLIANEGIDELRHTYPPLSTTSIDLKEMGRVVTQHLLSRISDPTAPTEHSLIPAELILTDSVGPHR
ncbi:LacI family DNA-binding transcriptional regulator [Ruegeria arenilitoris]|uniref:LacI family DNA-binding transcriptional regulator n=1 Tax=Ruegeria arenilitoris TaxID=1173585 RepID=UPI00147A7423|nr:LacI family DNA-binding transcriptional regulator [Ruegeria arenilitoris]